MAEYTIAVLLTSEDDATKTIKKFTDELGDTEKTAQDVSKSFRSFSTSSKSAFDSLLNTGRAAEASSDELGSLAAQLGVTSQAQVQAKMKMDSLIASWDRGEISSEELAQGLDGLGESTEEVGDDLFSLENVVKGAGAAISIDLAKQAAEAVFELGKLGAQSLRTESAFNAISGGADNATANLDAMRTATRGALSDQEMMAAASQSLQMGITSNADELGVMTEMAVRLGAAMGTEAGPAMENWNAMLANQSLPRLDTYGISSGRVKTRINDLMASVKGMTREQAFNTAVIEEGTLAMNRLGDAAADELLSFEQLDATITNLKTTMAEKAAPAVSQFAGTLNLLLTWNDRLAEAQAQSTAEIENTAESYDEYRARMEQVAAATGKTIDEEGRLIDSSHILNKTIIGLIAPIKKVADENFMMSESAFRAADTAELLSEKMERQTQVAANLAAMTQAEVVNALIEADDAMMIFTEGLEASDLSAESMAWNIELLSQSLGVVTTAEQQAQQDAELLTQAYAAGTISAGEYRQGLEGIAQGTNELTDAERQAIQTEIATADATRNLADAHRTAAEAAAGQAQETLALAGNLKDATSTQIANQMIGMLDPKKMGADAYSAAVKDIGLAFGTMDEESIALSENIGALATMIEEGTIPVESADEALSALIEDAQDGAVDIEELTDRFSDVPRSADEAAGSIDDVSGAVDGTTAAIDSADPNLIKLNKRGLQIEENYRRAELAVWGLIDALGSIPGDTGGGGGSRQDMDEYQHGTDYVPRTGPAFLHQGEMVIPPQQAQAIRSGGGEKMIIVAPIFIQPDEYETGDGLDYRAIARAVLG